MLYPFIVVKRAFVRKSNRRGRRAGNGKIDRPLLLLLLLLWLFYEHNCGRASPRSAQVLVNKYNDGVVNVLLGFRGGALGRGVARVTSVTNGPPRRSLPHVRHFIRRSHLHPPPPRAQRRGGVGFYTHSIYLCARARVCTAHHNRDRTRREAAAAVRERLKEGFRFRRIDKWRARARDDGAPPRKLSRRFSVGSA